MPFLFMYPCQHPLTLIQILGNLLYWRKAKEVNVLAHWSPNVILISSQPLYYLSTLLMSREVLIDNSTLWYEKLNFVESLSAKWWTLQIICFYSSQLCEGCLLLHFQNGHVDTQSNVSWNHSSTNSFLLNYFGNNNAASLYAEIPMFIHRIIVTCYYSYDYSTCYSRGWDLNYSTQS